MTLTVNNMFAKKPDKPKKQPFAIDPDNEAFAEVMQPFCSTDATRPSLCGVNFDELGVTATDANVILHLKGETELRGIYILKTPKCLENELDGKQLKDGSKYPQYAMVYPNKYDLFDEFTVDVAKLKRYAEEWLKSDISFDPERPKQRFWMAIDFDLYVNLFDAKNIIKACRAMLKLGYATARMFSTGDMGKLLFIFGEHTDYLDSNNILMMPCVGKVSDCAYLANSNKMILNGEIFEIP